jgi:hypothetical protein
VIGRFVPHRLPVALAKDINSPIVGRFVEEQEMVILSVKQYTTAIRGRTERGGWVSIIGSGGKTLFEFVGELEKEESALIGNYRVVADKMELAETPGGAVAEGADVLLRNQELEVASIQFGEGGQMYGQIVGGKYWAPLYTKESGCQADLIVAGYNERERVAIKGQSGHQMMLISDMVLLWDAKFKETLEIYAEDEALLKKEFGEAFQKLTELGCSFPAAPPADST